MKKLIICSLLIFSSLTHANEPPKDCTFQGIPLYGKVKIVDRGADINVQVVNDTPELRVQSVISSANSCGKWHFVYSSYDFTIKFVYRNPDLKIKYVSNRPGLP